LTLINTDCYTSPMAQNELTEQDIREIDEDTRFERMMDAAS
jgi:hypothetical protein